VTGLTVVHLIPSVSSRAFGLGPVALNLVREQRALGIDAKIWCLDSPSDVSWGLQSTDLMPESVVTFKPTGPGFLGYSVELERAVTGADGRGVHLIHQHGIWTGISRASNLWRGKFRRPTVIAPHGSLEEWAVRRSGWKKRIAKAAYEARNFREAACFHATAQPEAESFLRYGIRRPIAVVPNGLSNAWIDSEGSGARFRTQYALPADVRILLYLSRITPVKNLEMFLMAMARDRGALRDWLLVLAGPDEFGYQRKLEQLVNHLQLEPFVRFVGFVAAEFKRDAFAAASVFVLPSRREASPMSVLEALGAAVPVLTTRGTPWKEIEIHKCGWWCDVEVEGIGRALGTVLRASPEQLAELGERGRQLVRKKYTWSAAATLCQRLYLWLLGAAERPEIVLPYSESEGPGFFGPIGENGGAADSREATARKGGHP
jgi:glycosyltransferase involved in cell wall biosynthesis